MEKIMLDIVYMISLGYKNENKFRNTACRFRKLVSIPVLKLELTLDVM